MASSVHSTEKGQNRASEQQSSCPEHDAKLTRRVTYALVVFWVFVIWVCTR